MTTIIKERLEQIYAECEERDPAIFEIRELVRIALASMDAEPVRYLNKFSGVCVTLEQQPNAADDVAVYMPLYAAPPAPVVLTDEQREQLRQMDDEIVAELESEEIACRAAMLQANQRDLSQPVGRQVAEYEKIMLQAGWVMVPKTVTPEISLAINKVGQHCTCGNCSQRLWDMLLAAAPKPETGPCTK